MKWYHMKGPGGTICCKGDYEVQAKAEAAERWGCGTDEITVTGTEAYRESGENGFFGCAQNDSGAPVRAATGRQIVGATENGRQIVGATGGRPMTAPTGERRAANDRPYRRTGGSARTIWRGAPMGEPAGSRERAMIRRPMLTDRALCGTGSGRAR